MKIGPTKEEQLEALNADLLATLREISDGCVTYQPGHVNYNDNRTKAQIRQISDVAIAKAEAFKNQEP